MKSRSVLVCVCESEQNLLSNGTEIALLLMLSQYGMIDETNDGQKMDQSGWEDVDR
jgi:hypothetical protein